MKKKIILRKKHADVEDTGEAFLHIPTWLFAKSTQKEFDVAAHKDMDEWERKQ